MAETNQTIPKTDKEKLEDYKNDLYIGFKDQIAQFEKRFFFVVFGLLAFSITFIQEIVKIDQAIKLFYLFRGWFFLIASAAIIISTFIFSAYSSDFIRRKIVKMQRSEKKKKADGSETDYTVEDINAEAYQRYITAKDRLLILRITAVISFICGLSFLCGFIGSNLLNQNKVKGSNFKDTKTIEVKIDNTQILKTDTTLIITY